MATPAMPAASAIRSQIERTSQRPGTAKGFIFMSMEDETGIANIIVTPKLYDDQRSAIIGSKFLMVEGPLQNIDGVIHVKATRLERLSDSKLEVRSRDFR